jgi:dTDP-4-amino-4,6-dideoxygalactose transaminase
MSESGSPSTILSFGEDQHPVIPFNRPFIAGKELYYIAKAVTDSHISGDGPFTQRCHEAFRANYAGANALLTTSCTAALEMAMILLDIQPGDEVIIPSFTFPSTANAVCLRGGTPVFVDIRPDTLNIDETRIEAAITPRTKAVIPVHYAGVACEMDTILDIARCHQIRVVEDAAQAVGSTYRGKYLGTLGDLGCWSFHETKSLISGEGGALVIGNETYAERAEIVREKGTNRSQFFRGEAEKYEWLDVGSSFAPSDIIAAFLYAQLEVADQIIAQRHRVFGRYRSGLAGAEDRELLRLPHEPEGCTHSAHIFYLILRDRNERDDLLEFLRSRGIRATFHFLPLHQSPHARKLGLNETGLSVTEDMSGRLLRLPCYYDLAEADQDRIISSVLEYLSS